MDDPETSTQRLPPATFGNRAAPATGGFAATGRQSPVGAEDRVRQAALDLADAIDEANQSGYRVHWPPQVDGLRSIAVSETGTGAAANKAAAPVIG